MFQNQNLSNSGMRIISQFSKDQIISRQIWGVQNSNEVIGRISALASKVEQIKKWQLFVPYDKQSLIRVIMCLYFF